MQTILDSIEGIYSRLDKVASNFADISSLKCPTGCGRCCDMADTEVSQPEAQIIARYLVGHKLNRIKTLYEDFQSKAEMSGPRACIFYDECSDLHCQVYPVRPLICRCYGYSAERDKSGTLYFPLCGHMDLSHGLQNGGASLKILFEPHPPVMADFREEITSLAEKGQKSRLSPLAAAVKDCLQAMGRSTELKSR